MKRPSDISRDLPHFRHLSARLCRWGLGWASTAVSAISKLEITFMSFRSDWQRLTHFRRFLSVLKDVTDQYRFMFHTFQTGLDLGGIDACSC
jgi:hypothetical protein